MPTWPASLPQRPLKDGFQRQLGDAVVRSNPEHGPEQIRRRFTASEDTIAAQYKLTAAQWQTLLTFYKTTTKHGSLAFDWPDPMDGLNTVSVTFAEPPQIQRTRGADRYYVNVQLREQPS